MSEDSFVMDIDGKKTEFIVKNPSFKDQREAQKIYNQAFSDAVKSGCIVRGRLNDLLKEQGLWDDAKEMKLNTLQHEILGHEQTLAKGGISLQRARGVAMEMRKIREDLRELISSRTNLDNNTAEGQADNARFNYLVSACLVYSDNKKSYFSSYEDYLNRSADPVAIKGAQLLATRLYGLDDSYEQNLPENKFLKETKTIVKNYGYCVIVASEGIKNKKNKFIASSASKDSFGHAHLGGVAPKLANIISNKLSYKVHWAVADYLQRAARHLGSSVDVKQAYAIGFKALHYAKKGINGVMLTIKKQKAKTYKWEIKYTKLQNVANFEKELPKSFITKDGFGITSICKSYIKDLISGEDFPPYKNGVPVYAKLKLPLVKKKLKKFKVNL